MTPTSLPNHQHVKVESSSFGEYALPTKVKIQKKLINELEDNLRNYTVPRLYQIITSPIASVNFKDCSTHIDSQSNGEAGFFNLQVQLNSSPTIKTTIAKVLVSHELSSLSCSSCQTEVVNCFYKAMNESFSKSLPIHQTGNKIRNPIGESYQINPVYPNKHPSV